MDESPRRPSYDELLRENEALRRENEALRRENEALRRRVAELERKLQELLRRSKRQAAPFSKDRPTRVWKRSGRKPGANYGVKRQQKPPAQIDETHVAALPESCPQCGCSEREPKADAEQIQTDIEIRLVTRRFVVQQGGCSNCGRSLRGRHPQLASSGRGVAKFGYGPHLHALLALLRKYGGLSDAKTAAICRTVLKVPITPGAVAQSVARTARKLQPALDRIDAALRSAEVVAPDETGFRCAGQSGWCHVLVSKDTTRCILDRRRSALVTRRHLGENFAGSVIHDGYASYNKHFDDHVHQQCNAHVLRRAHELLDTITGTGKKFLRAVIALFREALAARGDVRAGPKERRCHLFEELTGRLQRLTARKHANRLVDRFRRHLRAHLWEWFTYLLDPNLEATNWRAEQAIRPMVLQRKMWGGVRSPAGGATHETLCSVLATLQQRGKEPLSFLHAAIANQSPVL